MTHPVLKKYFQERARKAGKAGGKATADNRTPEERSNAARKAVQARWAKRKKAKP